MQEEVRAQRAERRASTRRFVDRDTVRLADRLEVLSAKERRMMLRWLLMGVLIGNTGAVYQTGTTDGCGPMACHSCRPTSLKALASWHGFGSRLQKVGH